MNLYEKLAIFTTIETERLLLRPLTMADSEDMYAYASNPENLIYIFPAHKNIADTQFAIANFFMKAPLGKWAIELKSEQKMIGTITFVKLDEKKRIAEIGYALNMAYWGQGLMTEAVRTLTEIGLTEFGLYYLDIVVESENFASCKVAEKSGYTLKKSYKAINEYSKIIKNFKCYRKANHE
ncbi:GNAT family N-acetyltransferase [Lactococcus hodotermopsidis]|nr:GNAT family N-acetyltransferase [Lactococcus hodotermopsidis]